MKWCRIELDGRPAFGVPENSEIHAATLIAIISGDADGAAASAGRLIDHLERITRSALDRRTMR